MTSRNITTKQFTLLSLIETIVQSSTEASSFFKYHIVRKTPAGDVLVTPLEFATDLQYYLDVLSGKYPQIHEGTPRCDYIIYDLYYKDYSGYWTTGCFSLRNPVKIVAPSCPDDYDKIIPELKFVSH